jgi:hypothetical protein
MRSVGLGLALLASVQFAVVPAFAADTAKPVAKTAAATTTKVAKKKKRKAPAPETSTLQTTSGEVPAGTDPNATPAPAPAPAAPAPAPETPAPAAPAPAAPASPAAPADTAAAPAAPATPAGSVMVHIESPKPVSLEKRSGRNGAWEHVCNSPCDVATSTSDEYQILGDELNASNPFLLDGSQGEKITLEVTPGYHNAGARGGWVLAGGAALIVGGVVTLVAGSKSNYVAGDNGAGTSHNQNTDFIFAGSILLTAGVIAAIGGGALMYDNAHTKVEGAIGATPDKKDDVKGQVQVTAKRLPQWREDNGPQLGASHFVSVLSGTF